MSARGGGDDGRLPPQQQRHRSRRAVGVQSPPAARPEDPELGTASGSGSGLVSGSGSGSKSGSGAGAGAGASAGANAGTGAGSGSGSGYGTTGYGPTGYGPSSASAPAATSNPNAPTTTDTPGGDPERFALLGMRRTFSHEPETEPVFSCVTNPHTHLPVYTNIHRIRRDIVSIVEDYLSLEQLRDVRINVSVVRPLVDKLYELDDISIVYCLLVNRAQFLHEQSHLNNRQNVNYTRATLCELVATRILRRYNEDNDGPDGLLVLAHILIAGFEPFQNAPEEIRREASLSGSWLYHKTLPALEVAILSESKLFLSSTSCQKVVDAIYEGRVIYTPSSFLDIIPDRYKQKPISLYDPRGASLLNQYRLIVPRTRNILEVLQFVILLLLYLLFMAERDPTRCSVVELCFAVYAFGWVLDQFATILEHGWHVYTQNLWSFLDVTFALVYWGYLILRIHGWRVGSLEPGQQALDVLAMGAPVLVPRIAFNLLSDNLLFVCLRAMMADFTLLTALAVWCFGGFLLSLAWLGEGAHPIVTISKWMVYIWFGLDGTGIQRSVEFHWLLGPALMVTFAFLGNTLFLTILVSMLSNTFSTIVSNATAEIQFRHAVLTLEGVKSDAIFAYQPPFNILALLVLVPLKFLVSPRWFHKIHVASVRAINLPLLLIIAFAERRLLYPGAGHAGTNKGVGAGDGAGSPAGSGGGNGKSAVMMAGAGSGWAAAAPRRSFWDKWRITTHGDIQAVFELPPPDSFQDEIAADDELTHHLIRRQFTRQGESSSSSHHPHGRSHNHGNNDNHRPSSGTGRRSIDAGQQTGASIPPAMPSPAQQQQPSTTTQQTTQTQSQPQPPTPGQKSSVTFTAPSEIQRGRTGSTAGTGSDGARTPRPHGPHHHKSSGARRDSMAFPGLAAEVRGLLAAPEDLADVQARLDSLEAAVARVEALLGRLVDGENRSRSRSRSRSGSGSGSMGRRGGSGDDRDERERGEYIEESAGADNDIALEEESPAEAERAVESEAEEAEAGHTTGTLRDLDQTADEQ